MAFHVFAAVIIQHLILIDIYVILEWMLLFFGILPLQNQFLLCQMYNMVYMKVVIGSGVYPNSSDS